MNDDLYQQAMKELARAAHGSGRLAHPSASSYLDNPLCGDRITLDLRVENDVVVEVAHETRGCLICRAAASLLAHDAPGKTLDQLARVRADLEALLAGHPAASPQWPDLALFAPIHAHKSRHGCVLLPFRALSLATNGSGQR
ncbi:Iron-sulfur cluster assembly scaffold protein [Georgfuchsia toluolica]|uniref:Iron-sulfur cluster assembly scaffold protein n=1 Tax=Georgfuchsia toluolica TaxID=424218 RepID=A0A916N999_9PROT|nr:iron-sulfur cluster assembly scaffold protein [Georgfuchsia toluolica]CAG4883630.1 Iron-sulfur cluster assembly scaffold protein [Georgfuchsia toluolica]